MRSRSADLRRWLERQDLTMEELVDTADTLVRELAPKQTKYKVTERPDARTIRYYVTQGLLPKPVGYEGGRARYAGTHLLRLLLLKRMQSEHHTLNRIAHVLTGASDEEVLAALNRDAEPQAAAPPPPISQAEPSPASAVGTRLDLAGGSVEVGDDVLKDPEKRMKLAGSLEALAAWLRNTGEKK